MIAQCDTPAQRAFCLDHEAKLASTGILEEIAAAVAALDMDAYRAGVERGAAHILK